MKEDQNIYYHHRKQLVETQEAESCDLRIIKKDGTFWAHLDTAVQDADGETAYRVVINDITEHKKLENELQKVGRPGRSRVEFA